MDIDVELLSLEEHDGYVVKTLSVTKVCIFLSSLLQCIYSRLYPQSKETHHVTHFHILNWKDNGQCSNFSTVLEVIEKMGIVQKKTGNNPTDIYHYNTLPS